MNSVLNPPGAETVTLHYREGSSDKVYQCSVEPSGELFVVNFAYGRRGSTLSTGTKTSAPVEYDTEKRSSINSFARRFRRATHRERMALVIKEMNRSNVPAVFSRNC